MTAKARRAGWQGGQEGDGGRAGPLPAPCPVATFYLPGAGASCRGLGGRRGPTPQSQTGPGILFSASTPDAREPAVPGGRAGSTIRRGRRVQTRPMATPGEGCAPPGSRSAKARAPSTRSSTRPSGRTSTPSEDHPRVAATSRRMVTASLICRSVGVGVLITGKARPPVREGGLGVGAAGRNGSGDALAPHVGHLWLVRVLVRVALVQLCHGRRR
jgi:hypothetical protein